MPRRKIPIETGKIYHLYNRGVDGEATFTHKYHYQKAIEGLWYYRFHKPPIRLAYFKSLNQQATGEYVKKLQTHPLLVDVIAFVLMPDHYHIIVRQLIDGGTSRFMANMQNSYTRYFNARKDRKGQLFERQFEALPVEDPQHVLYLSKYIHRKPLDESRVDNEHDLLHFDWSSLPEYMQIKAEHLRFCNQEPVMTHFQGVDDYRNFVLDTTNYRDQLEAISYARHEE